jgi:hypothetical protein
MKNVKTEVVVWNLGKIMKLIRTGKIHPNPIGQRPAVTEGHGKSIAIIKACLYGYGVGMIIVRDIRGDAEMQKVYPGYDYLVVDGGHRIRAIEAFERGRFKINGKTYGEFADVFETIEIPFSLVQCTSKQAIEIFRNVNKTTGVNAIEMIMCDDESVLTQLVRARTMYYKEYGNKPLPIFSSSLTNSLEQVAEHFAGAPNPRREWDKYVFVAMNKVINKGNCDAGEGVTVELINKAYEGKNPVNKTVMATVDRFFEDVLDFKGVLGTKLNGDIYSAIQLVWFALYEKNQNFKIDDMYRFRDEFMSAYTLLTGRKNADYNDKTIVWEGETVNIKEFVRRNMKNFANGMVQRKCAELMLEEMDDNIGVVFRDSKRSITRDERAEHLATQKYRCAIDGESLTLEDSVWGHDTPWAKGGKLEDGAVINRRHNIDMGSLTLDEYRMVLKNRTIAA